MARAVIMVCPLREISFISVQLPPALQLYSFGETVSIVMWTDSWQPDSYYDKIAANRSRGLHTLCLLGKPHIFIVHFCDSLLLTATFQNERVGNAITSCYWFVLSKNCDENYTVKVLSFLKVVFTTPGIVAMFFAVAKNAWR